MSKVWRSDGRFHDALQRPARPVPTILGGLVERDVGRTGAREPTSVITYREEGSLNTSGGN